MVPVTWISVDWPYAKPCGIHLRAILKEMLQTSILDIYLKLLFKTSAAYPRAQWISIDTFHLSINAVDFKHKIKFFFFLIIHFAKVLS